MKSGITSFVAKDRKNKNQTHTERNQSESGNFQVYIIVRVYVGACEIVNIAKTLVLGHH